MRSLDSSDRVNIFASVEKQQAIISEYLVSEGAKELFEASSVCRLDDVGVSGE